MNNKQTIPDRLLEKLGFKIHISPWLVWGLGAAFFFAEYFARVAPSVMVPDLMRDFGVDALTLGSLSAFFYYAYVGMQIPVGILVDRYGAHRLLTLMSIFCGLGCFLFASAKGVGSAELGRLLMGFGASFAFVGSLKLAAVWFPATRFGLLAGLTQALGMLGAAVGQAPMSFSVMHFGWRPTMFAIAIIFMVLAIFMWIIIRDRPPGVPVAHEPLASDKNILAGLSNVLANPQSWWNALYVGLVYAPTAAIAELWGVTFLAQNYHLSRQVAATAVSLIFIGWGVGGPLIGWFSDRIQRRRPLMLASALGCLVFLSLILYLPINTPIVILYSAMFLYGIFNTGVATSYAVASEINPRGIAGTSVAFANMASVIIGALFQPLIGWILDLNWDGKMQDGAPIYSAHAFHLAFLLFPICLAFSVVLVFFVKETYCKGFETREMT
jgi:MFS family permease